MVFFKCCWASFFGDTLYKLHTHTNDTHPHRWPWKSLTLIRIHQWEASHWHLPPASTTHTAIMWVHTPHTTTHTHTTCIHHIYTLTDTTQKHTHTNWHIHTHNTPSVTHTTGTHNRFTPHTHQAWSILLPFLEFFLFYLTHFHPFCAHFFACYSLIYILKLENVISPKPF